MGEAFEPYNTYKSLSTLRLTHRLPKEGEDFNLKFITHGAYDNPDVFYALLTRAFKESQKNEILMYSNYIGDYTRRVPKAFMSLKIPYGFYTLLPGAEQLPHYLQPNPFIPPPDFNFAQV